jgi:hypothetical protein
VLIVADDVEDHVADGTRIDLDVIMSRRQFSHQAFGDVAIGRNDNFASLTTSSKIGSPRGRIFPRELINCSINSRRLRS